MTKLPLDPEHEIFKWGPSARYPLLRIETAAIGLFKDFSELFKGYSWPPALILVDRTRFIWMHEARALQEAGAKLFIDRMLPKETREPARAAWKDAREELSAAERKIGEGNLTAWSDEELLREWNEFHELIRRFWAHSSLPELANYGSIELITEKLKGAVSPDVLPSTLEILTAPTGLSFYQEEEIDLAETNDVEAHQRKYFWLKNSYAHIEVLPASFFVERKQTLSPHIREEATERLAKTCSEKRRVIAEYGLSQEIADMADAIDDAIVWQDMRKKDIWVYLHYQDVLLAEITQRMKIDKNVLGNGTDAEIASLFKGVGSVDSLIPRQEVSGIGWDEKAIWVIEPETAREYWKLFVDTVSVADVNEFTGIIASKGKGKAQGRVRIVLDSHNHEGFEDGDVLVTTMTTPEFVFLMKKAAAIVTDTGGLTSHAAIVSRELGVPCLVGTKVATKVLKDGDRVEVDAEKGIVRKL
jgi:phosphohistidine swiveling domain-containing protein